MKQIKALALISGGLDSILSALLIKKQGIDVHGLVFKSYFFDAKHAKKIAKHAKIPIITKDFSKQHLKIIKNPIHGYGKRANPCIDCHLLMFREVKKLLPKLKANFVISGEVLGQRPFSQNKNALQLIEKQSNLKGLILRPLSAKFLPITIPEQKNWVDREKLLDISGRSRKKQLELAQKYHLKDFSAPGASCILTDPEFSKRLFKLLKVNPKCKINDIQLLKLGRHFWHPEGSDLKEDEPLKGQTLIIIGRNHEENLKLIKLAQKNDIILELKKTPGPTVLIRPYQHKPNEQILEKAKKLLLRYSQRSSSLSKKIILVHCKDYPL